MCAVTFMQIIEKSKSLHRWQSIKCGAADTIKLRSAGKYTVYVNWIPRKEIVSTTGGEIPALFSAATVTVYVLGASSPVKVVLKDDTVLVVAPGPPCRVMV